MKKNGTAVIARYRRVLRLQKPRLLAFDNVFHVDVGYRYVSSKRTHRLAIRLFVNDIKRVRTKAKSRNLAPPHIAGVPIDVVCGKFGPHCLFKQQAARIAPQDPIVGGISIGTASDEPGTLGVVTRSSQYSGLIGLTSNHIAPPGSSVFQPSPSDAAGGQRIGMTVDADPMLFASMIQLECSGRTGVLLKGPVNVADYLSASEISPGCDTLLSVMKVGRTSGVTTGVLEGVDDEDRLTIGSHDGHGLAEIGCGGDSGSVWTTMDGVAVGLHYAGSVDDRDANDPRGGSQAFAQAMWRIVDRFGLKL